MVGFLCFPKFFEKLSEVFPLQSFYPLEFSGREVKMDEMIEKFAHSSATHSINSTLQHFI